VILILGFLSCVLGSDALGATVRDISSSDGHVATITLDSPVSVGASAIEYTRDMIQLTLKNSTLYPAKIENYPSGSFTKIFAYQYSPGVVRVRFTVPGKSEHYRGKIKVQSNGKRLQVVFPKVATVAESKVTEPEPTKENTKEFAVDETRLLKKVLDSENKAKTPETNSETTDRASGSAPINLGGKKDGPTPWRAMGVMLVMLGGLLGFLYWLKRKQGQSQVSARGSWFSQLLPDQWKKTKQFIEVIANTPLGPKQNILLVKIRGQQLVLGVTQDRIQLITQIDSDFAADLTGDPLGDPAVSASLSQMFGGSGAISGTSSNFDKALKRANAADVSMKSVTVTENKSALQQTPGTYRAELRKKLEAMRSL